MVTLIIVAVFLCWGCAPEETNVNAAGYDNSVISSQNTPGSPNDQIIMRVGHAQPITHPRHQSYLLFKKLVEERTNNKITVQIFPSAQLGSEMVMLDQVKSGVLEGTRGGSFESMAPELLIYTLPFLFDSLDSIQKVTTGSIGEKIAKHTEKNGLVTLAIGDSGGFYSITNNSYPITSPKDFVGLKMRTPPIATKIETMKAFGAEPVIMAYGDVYLALKEGIVDGQDNPLVNIESMRFYEVQRYLTLIEYQFCPDPFIVNLEWYESLNEKYRTILKECAVEAMKYNDELVWAANEKALGVLSRSMIVIELTDEQKRSFKDKVQPVYDYFIEQGLFSQEDIDEIRASIEK